MGEGDPGGGQRRATGTGTERKGVKRSPGGVMRATGTRACDQQSGVAAGWAKRQGPGAAGPVGDVGGGGRGGRGEGRAAEAGRDVRQRPRVRTSAGQQGRGGSGRGRHRSYAASAVCRGGRQAVSPCGLDRKPFLHGFRLGPGGRCGGGCGDLTLMRASAMALFVFLCWNFTCTDTLFIDKLYINLVVVSKKYNSIFLPYYFFLEFD